MADWYYLDAANQTKGPVKAPELQKLYGARTISDTNMVWNGTTVGQWTKIADLPANVRKEIVPPAPAPAARAPPPARAPAPGPPRPARPSPFGGAGGGRGDLLAAIRKGNSLKKVAPTKERAPAAAAPASGGGSMMDQMKARLNAMHGGSSRPAPARPSPAAQSRPGPPAGRPGPPAGRPGPPAGRPGPPSGRPAPSRPSPGLSARPSPGASASGSAASGNPKVSAITRKLDSAEDWQIKAIEAILR